MIIDINKPSKMFCSFAYIDPQYPQKSSFISVAPINKSVGFVLGELVENSPHLKKQIDPVMEREKMSLINAIQLLCICKDKFFG